MLFLEESCISPGNSFLLNNWHSSGKSLGAMSLASSVIDSVFQALANFAPSIDCYRDTADLKSSSPAVAELARWDTRPVFTHLFTHLLVRGILKLSITVVIKGSSDLLGAPVHDFQLLNQSFVNVWKWLANFSCCYGTKGGTR